MNIASHRNNNFDVLRWLASFFVLFDHTTDAIQSGPGLNYLSWFKINLSSIGVSIFFIISGYLVTQSRIQNTRMQFLRKRALRILPAFYVCTLILTFVVGVCFTNLSIGNYLTHTQTYQYIFRCFTFTPTYSLPGVFQGAAVNAPVWSLTYEVVCYIVLWALPASFIQKKNLWLILFILTSIIVLGFYFPSSHKIFFYILKASQMSFIFFIGALLYYYKEYIVSHKFLFFVVSISLFAFLHRSHFSLTYLQYSEIVFLALSVIALAFIKIPFKMPIDISYGVYLYAYPIQQILYYSFPINTFNTWIYLLTTFVLSMLVGTASWYVIEKRFMQLK